MSESVAVQTEQLRSRPLKPEEFASVLNHPEIHRREAVPLGRTDLSRWIPFVERINANGIGGVVALERGDEILGVICWAEHQDIFSLADLATVFLWVVFDRSNRGKGYGRMLLEFLEQRCDHERLVLVATAPATDAGLEIAHALTDRGYRMVETHFARQPRSDG